MSEMMQTAADVVQFSELTSENGKKIGVATLNSEKSLNALSLPMVELLLPQMQQWKDNPDIAMVLLQGAGDKAFCAGGDIRDLYHTMKASRRFRPDGRRVASGGDSHQPDCDAGNGDWFVSGCRRQLVFKPDAGRLWPVFRPDWRVY